MEKFDAIVIGAGPGGSTISGLLAAQGKKILVVDKNARAGGKMTAIHKYGHTYEMFPLNMIPNGPSLFEKLAEETGKAHKIRNVAADESVKDDVRILYRDRKGKVHRLAMRDPKSMLAVGVGPLHLPKIVSFMKRHIGMSDEEISKLENISAYDYMKQQNLPEAVFVYLTAAFGEGTFEMSSDLVPASHLVRVMQLAISSKHPTPRYYEGGIGGFFETILETVEEKGGKLLMGTRVKSIDVVDGQAVGITTELGESYVAPIIVSNAGIRQTVHKLVGDSNFDEEYADRINGLQSNLADVGYRYFTSKPVLKNSTTVYFPWNCLEPWSAFEEMAAGTKKPESNYMYIGTKSIFPTVSPEGKQIIYACMSCHPDPEQNLQPYLDYVENVMKELYPALYEDGVIEHKEVMDLESVFKLGVDKIFKGQGGESYGIANSLGQADGDMPRCKTPLNGLYIVGNDAEGFGVGCHRAVDSGFKLFEHLKEDGIITP
ncbi:MAG: phytoene desaturase family protein [Dysgonomonas sp.]